MYMGKSNKARRGSGMRVGGWLDRLEGRCLLSTVVFPAPDGTDQGGLLRQYIDTALRGAGDAVVQLQAGTYITNPSPRDWVFASQADFDGMWQVTGGTAVVDTVAKVLVLTPTAGGTSMTIQLKDSAALGIFANGIAPYLLTQFTAVTSSTTAQVFTRSQGVTAYVGRGSATAAVGLSQLSLAVTSGAPGVVNGLQLKLTKTSGTFATGNVFRVSSMKVRLDRTWAYAGLGINDLREQHVLPLDMSYIGNKSVTLVGPSPSTRALLMTQLPMSDFLNVGDLNNLTIQNVDFDYENRPWVQANITAVNAATSRVTVTLDSPLDLTRMRDPNFMSLIADGANPSGSSLWATARVLDADHPGRMALGVAQNVKVYFNQSDSFDGTEAYSPTRTYSVLMDTVAGVTPGMHMTWTSRNGAYSTVRFSGNNLTMRDVNVYKSGGTMVSSFGAGATGITTNGTTVHGGKFVFENVSLAPRESERDVQWLTQPADGIHINSPYYVSTGPNDPSIFINNLRIESNNDDSIAIYQSGGDVTAVSGNRLTVAMPFLPKVGDLVVVYGHPGVERGRSTVTAVSGSVITLATAIPAVVNADVNLTDHVFNLTRSAQNSYLGNSTFQDPRGNGLKTRMGSWVVENNTFVRLGWSAVSLGTEINGNNTSGPFPGGVVIRNNYIEDVNFSDSSNQLLNGAIEAGMMTASGAKPFQDRLIRDLTIVSNTFVGIARAAINITSTEGVRIEGNTITSRTTDPTPADHTGPVIFNNVRGSTVVNNTITETRSKADAAISVDALYALNWFTTKNFDGTPTMRPSTFPVVSGNVVSVAGSKPEVLVGRWEDSFTGTARSGYFGVTAAVPAAFSVPTSGTYANQLVFSGTTLEGIYRRYGVYGDLTLSAKVTVVQNYVSNGTGDGSGLIFRATNSGAHPNYKLTSFYWLAVDPTAGFLKLVRRDGSVNATGTLSYTESVLTQVAVPGGVPLGTTFSMRVEAIGNVIKGFATNLSTGEATSLAFTDGSPLAIGWGGVGVRTNGTLASVSGTKTVYDDLVAQANAVPTSTTTPAFVQGAGLTGVLSTVAVDDAPEPRLTYEWSQVSGPGTATFGPNGNNAAKTTSLTVSAAGTYVFSVRVTDETGESSATTVTAAVVAQAPTLTAFEVNDGSAQRSMVNSLTLRFNKPVSLSAGALTLTRRASTFGGPATAISFDLVPGYGVAGQAFTLSFAGRGLPGASLTDGAYDLALDASLVSGDGQVLVGGNRVFSFTRVFGDATGDGRVNATDLAVMKPSVWSTTGGARYVWYFDFNQDGAITDLDWQMARARNGNAYVI